VDVSADPFLLATQLVRQKNKQPDEIFTDDCLEILALTLPTSSSFLPLHFLVICETFRVLIVHLLLPSLLAANAFKNCDGVTPESYEAFGKPFLTVCKNFFEEENGPPPAPAATKKQAPSFVLASLSLRPR
jgi:hypothetical protein